MQDKYNHNDVERNKNELWINEGVFHVPYEDLKTGRNFSIILPPPNVTGKLHLGHAWDTTLQDMLIRYKKMQGYNVVWLPGMDHAGIATQSKVENLLYKEGITKHDLGREKFLEKTWEWKHEYAKEIREQWGKLGLGLDYKREKFTLDDDSNKLVNKVFVNLYEQDLIYQGYRITNWDPKAQTALSDIEVIHKDIEGAEHYFKYVLADDPNDYLEIMTTRPETMFGDGALAVHPDDTRYNHLVGKEYIIPNTNTKIPVILDEYVDPQKGSGVVKITMAHDPNDFEVAKRHNMEPRIIMDADGKISKNEFVPEEFWGLDRFDARAKQVKKADENGLLIKVDKITHSVGHSERSGVVVEPLLSKQWYVKMAGLAKKSLEVQKTNDKVEFFPSRFENTFSTWMENIQDWCISRQLWWGHQIPAWYKGVEIYVGETPPEGEGWVQDEDVLDTWFSSSLWPMTMCNILEEDSLMDFLYPHSVLVTGYDIIFFWVSRMIFQSLHFTNKVPFKKVLIHGLIRDENGKKMSKSLGNGIDPMDVIDEYGADSLRYFLTTNSTPGQDLRYSQEKLNSTWNFLNKIWNISRYVLTNTEDIVRDYNDAVDLDKMISQFKNTNSADHYILSRLNETIKYVERMMDKYEFTEVGSKIYAFAWDDFAAWYLETSKVVLSNGTVTEKHQTKVILFKVLLDILKMLHPFVPFITEEIYQEINKEAFIVNNSYPKHLNMNFNLVDKYVAIQNIITEIRNFKATEDIKPSQEVEIILQRIGQDYFSKTDYDILKKFGRISSVNFVDDKKLDDVYTKVFKDLTLNIVLEGLVDKGKKEDKLLEQVRKVEQELQRSSKMLANEKFVNNAKKEKLEEEINKALGYLNQYKELEVLAIEMGLNINVKINITEFENYLKNLL